MFSSKASFIDSNRGWDSIFLAVLRQDFDFKNRWLDTR